MSSNNEGPVVQPQPLRRRISLRFTLKTLLVAILVAALLIVWMQERGKRLEMTRLAGAQLEVCDSLAELKTALGASDLQVVDFDDVDTSKTDYVAFAADRYADRGITVTGEGGQYAGRVFSNPKRAGGILQYSPNSAPNSYAPGRLRRATRLRPRRRQPDGHHVYGRRTVSWCGGLRRGVHRRRLAQWRCNSADRVRLGRTEDRRDSGGPRRKRNARIPRRWWSRTRTGRLMPVISHVEVINGGCWPEVVTRANA